MKCAVKDTKDFVEGDVQISVVKEILPGVSSRIFFIFSRFVSYKSINFLLSVSADKISAAGCKECTNSIN